MSAPLAAGSDLTPVAVPPAADPLLSTIAISSQGDTADLPTEDKPDASIRASSDLGDSATASLSDTAPDAEEDDRSIVISPLSITLLLVSGLRGSITIDREYLKLHALGLRDPESLTVLTLKECIWKDWKEEWGEHPSSTNYIRLIHFGRLLDDKDTLASSQLSRTNMYNVLHMSVRPVSIDGVNVPIRGSKHRSSGSNNERSGRTHFHAHLQGRQRDTSAGVNSTPPENTQERSAGCGCVIL